MGRAILSVIAGYIAMGVVVFGGLSAAWMALGADKAFKPGTWEVTPTWIVIALVVGFIAAIIGGWIAAAIAKTSTPPKVLALIVLVLGLAMAVYNIFIRPQEPTTERPPDVTLLDAWKSGQKPPISSALDPIIGATGVLIGLRIREKSRKPAAT